MFFLTKTKHQIDKTSLFFFLLFRRAFIKENPQLKSFEQEELLLNYNETFDIIRETFRNYSVYDDFLVKFNSNVIIRSPYCFLEKIAQKFNFLNKNDAILHLETILQRSDLSNKNQLIYGSFKELMLKTYDIDVGNEESLDMKEGEEIIYPNLIKKLTDSMKIDFYEVQNTIIQAFCEVICEKNELNRKNMLETINLFDYRPFKEKNKEYGPLIFSGVFFENNFLKIHDYLKKKANQSCDKSLNILDNLEFTDFYNKNKIKEHFFEILAFNDMISYVNSHFIPPQPEKIKAIEEKTSFNSRNSSYSRNSRVSFKGKKSNHIENSPVNKTKKSNIFSGIKLILAKKPFKRKTKQLNIK